MKKATENLEKMKSNRYSDRSKTWIIKNEIEKQLKKVGAPYTSVIRYASEILIFTPNVAYFVQENKDLIKRLAQRYRVRIKLRSDPEHRMSEEEALKLFQDLFPELKDAKLWFDRNLGELNVEVPLKLFKDLRASSRLQEFFVRTGWKIILHKQPLLSSNTVRVLYRFYEVYQDEIFKIRKKAGDIIRKPVSKKNKLWVRLIALGGYNEVGRTCHVIQTPNDMVLVDVGVNVGTLISNEERYPYLEVLGMLLHYNTSAIVITHAHLDHIGFLPYIYKLGCEIPIYATEPTRDLMYLLLTDFVDVSRKNGIDPMYDKEDVKKMMKYLIPTRYGEVYDIAPDMRVTFYNAGHILGSAILHIHVGEGDFNLVIANDFKLSGTPILGKAYTNFQYINGLILESTYGGSEDIQEPREQAEKRLIESIKQTVLEDKGKVLIPVFAVGRAQEIMYTLVKHRDELENIPIYVDGMVKEATAIYTKYPEYLDPKIAEKLYKGENPFIDDRFQFVSSSDERQEIAKSDEPAVIIASSGMLVGGPSVEYFMQLSGSERNKVIFVGYQAHGTLGRKLIDGERKLPVLMEGKRVILEVKLKVEQIKGFSGHSDRNELVRFVNMHRDKIEKLILAHGEPSKIESLANYFRRKKKFKVYTPENLEAVRLR
jgi:KH/beta-lactamase-domain protein